MKTRLLKRLRNEAKKRIRIKQQFGGIEGPIYSIDNDGITHQNREYRFSREDHPYLTHDLSEAINEAYPLRRSWIIGKVSRIRIEKAREKQPDKYLDI